MENNRNDGHNKKLQIRFQPNIGLDSDVRRSIVELLNNSLANEIVLTLKTRNAHWNVSGTGFFELHALFNSQYGQLNNISNQIAERTRMLGGFAIGSLQEFITHARIKEHVGIVPDLMALLTDHETVIRLFREDARKCTEEYGDEGTFDLLIGVMRRHEKMAWMLRSHLIPDPIQVKSQS